MCIKCLSKFKTILLLGMVPLLMAFVPNERNGNSTRLPKQPSVLLSKPHSWKFDFGTGKIKRGFTPITSKTIYSEQVGYGIIPFGPLTTFDQKKKNKLTCDGLSSNNPFYFKLDLPEGRYKVTLGLGNADESSAITVKAESRRLMLENILIDRGELITKTILVDVRTPQINETEKISLNSRELPFKNWDNSLSLEFNGKNPSVRYVQIERVDEFPVIFLAGNSTVTDQENEPWASWGQMFPRFLKPEIVVANYAESGETLKSFRWAKRLKKVLSVMKPGDYLLMEFAHNDQKPGASHVEPYTTYLEELRYFINEAKKKGGIPVLVTSTNRRKFDETGKIINTLEDYPDAMKQLARVDNIPLIDLNQKSKELYEALGVEDSKKAFVHYPANTFPDQNEPLEDNTHFNTYGAYELAKCVVQEIKIRNLDLAKYIVDDFSSFDPATPDSFDEFFWPDSPIFETAKPKGK